MELLEKHLVVKPSRIPNAGKGLFTKKFIAKGTRIVEYTGEIVKWKDVEHDEGNNVYIFFVNRNHVIDASKNPEELGRYANDGRGLKRIKGLVNNCEYVLDKKKRVFLESRKDIPPGGELLVGYGKDYWDVIRKNMRIDKEKIKKAADSKR